MKKLSHKLVAVLLALVLIAGLASVSAYADPYTDRVVDTYISPGGWTGPMVISNNKLIPRPYYGGDIANNKVSLNLKDASIVAPGVYKLDISLFSEMSFWNVGLAFKFNPEQLEMCSKTNGAASEMKSVVFSSATTWLTDTTFDGGVSGANYWSNTEGTFAFHCNVNTSSAGPSNLQPDGESLKLPAGGLTIGSVYFKLKGDTDITDLDNESIQLDNDKAPQLFGDAGRTGADLSATWFMDADSNPFASSPLVFLKYAMDLEVTSSVGTISAFTHLDTQSGPPPTATFPASEITVRSAATWSTPERIQGELDQPQLYSSTYGSKIYISAYRIAGSTDPWEYTHDVNVAYASSYNGGVIGDYYPLPRSLPVGEYELLACVPGNFNFLPSEMVPVSGTYKILAPLPHVHDYTPQVTTDPTCTAAGVTTYTCAGCGDSYTESLPAALGHDYSIQQSIITPTCDEQGYTIYKCSRCTATENRDYTGKLSHDYTPQVTTDPTCTVAGVTTYTCANCNDSYTEALPPALGHDYTVKQSTVAPTCDEQGYTVYKCSRCTATENRDYTAKLTHDYTPHVTTDPTCTAKGVTTYTCAGCSDSYTQNLPAALGHDYSIKQNTVAPTYDTQGYTVYKCSRCTATENRDYTAKINRPEPTKQYIKLWGKTTKYVSNFGNWLLCIFLFGWIWMAF